jgi:hypothetical protein
MYLSKKTYVKNWDHNPNVKHKVTVKLNNKIRKDIKAERICGITEDVMYWRKANHIHRWFVENVQEGTDNCGSYHVSVKELRELKETCEQALDALSSAPKKTVKVKSVYKDGEWSYSDEEVYDCEELEDILPITSGFFFGSTNYDERYKQNLEDTIEGLEKALSDVEEDDYNVSFEYSSSW